MHTLKKCLFRFYAELNDFLPKAKKFQTFTYPFNFNPSIKDAIEAIGVPHTEVDLILVNSNSVDFSYRLKEADFVSVYPVFELLDISAVTHLRPEPLRVTKFILDVNLCRLAKKLRLFGFDSLYSNSLTDKEIVKTALIENRIILTRNIGLLKDKRTTHGYWVRSTEADAQTAEIIAKYDLYNKLNPFSICMVCNGKIKAAKKENIEHRLLPETKKSFDDFYQCAGCGKIYWKGSHYSKMVSFVESVKQTNTSL